ncbi:MAG: ABC transporter permease [Spirochaetes bacterium]|nr:ABC transporter permease [Spirochaetota bacterium]
MSARGSLIRIFALADKEWIQVRRDLRSLILSILLPVMLLLLFGYALNMDVNRVSTAVYDQDKSALSRALVDKLSHTEYLTISRYLESHREIDALIDRGDIILAVVIPPSFERNYMSGKRADIQLIVDGSDSTSAMVATGYVKAILFNINRDRKMDELNRAGVPGLRMPVEVQSRVWYNPELKSRNFIIPGIVVLIMAIISALITALTISREWERGTMESLISTPVRKHELFIGKLLPYVFIALFDLVITLTLGHFIFDVPIRGSFVELYTMALLFLVGTCSLGILISSATRVQVVSIQAAMMVTYLPSLILSGFIFPVKNMPLVVQAITYLVPAKYLILILKAVALKGVGYTMLWTQVVFMVIFALGVGALSLKKLTLRLPE